MSVKFYIATLGCKVNQYESQAMSEAWSSLGWEECDDAKAADVIVVNSCAVTASAVADVRTTVRRMYKVAPHAKIWVTGCTAQVQAHEMLALPGVAGVIAAAQKDDFLDNPHKFLAEDHKLVEQDFNLPRSARLFPRFNISTYKRARPVLKVQDGCSHFCTYCIVPLARGGTVSREPQSVLDEARRLLEGGFEEIIISGINLSQYRYKVDKKSWDFWDLLNYLDDELAAGWHGKARFRLSSLEPGQLGERALALFAKSALIAPHLHVSLQSGSSSVLERMGRGHYNPASLLEFCAELKKVWPVFGLGADLLCGFPGETDVEFEQTRELVEALPFTYAHVFPFSVRPGTKAAAMNGQVPKSVGAERAAILRAIIQAKKEAFLKGLVEEYKDKPLRMILESREKGVGVCEFYAECVLKQVPDFAQPRESLAVRPVAVEKGKLVVVVDSQVV